MAIEFKGGRLPNNPNKPRLRLASFLKPTLEVPESVDYLSNVVDFPMYLNDRYGDCTCAGAGHIIQAESRYGQGATQTVTDQDVLKAYEDVSGFNPDTGEHDDGAVMQDVLNYWRKTGIGGHKILAFAEVDIHDEQQLKYALEVFGSLYIGINFPNTAMDQFNNGKPWDFVNGAYIEGGHAINGGAYGNGADWKVVTWGQVQEMTQEFWNYYVEEAWIVITPEWFNANGQSPTGLDLSAMGEELAKLTGGENPFRPGPEPTPEPTPTPVVDDADKVLQEYLLTYFKKHSTRTKLAQHLLAWLDAKS